MFLPNTIVITGASSGIGAALALCYATAGKTLYLLGRNSARLEEVAVKCRAKGAQIETASLCVTDSDGMRKTLTQWNQKTPIDLVIANAGISGGMSKGDEAEQKSREIFDINFTGTLNTIYPLIPLMQARKRGHIALVSSMAGFRGMPNAPAYSTSKVAVRALGDALRPLLKSDGVIVSTIFPGFIKTPLTDVNKFPMPFLMEPEKAAQIIKSGLDKGRAFIAFPRVMYLSCWMLGVIPRCLGDFILSRAPKKS